MLKSQLDMRICDCEYGAINTQTYREFIREAEQEINGFHEDLDSMTEDKLNEHLYNLDYLLSK